MLPEYQALAAVVFVLSGLTLFIMRARSSIRYFLYLFVIGSVACLCASAFNEAYVGLIDANPSSLFLKFSLPERLHLWTSPEQLAYVAMSFANEVKISGTGFSIDVVASSLRALLPFPKLILLLSFSLIPGLLLIWINFHRKVRQPLPVKLALPFGLAAINLIAYIGILFPRGQDNGFVERLSVLRYLFLADFIVLFLV